MKIVMIHGQNHKGSTYNIGRMIANKISREDDIVEFFLPRDLNHFCLGCYACIEDVTKCPFYEEKNKIMSAVLPLGFASIGGAVSVLNPNDYELVSKGLATTSGGLVSGLTMKSNFDNKKSKDLPS
jgi:hypothetical protein